METEKAKKEQESKIEEILKLLKGITLKDAKAILYKVIKRLDDVTLWTRRILADLIEGGICFNDTVFNVLYFYFVLTRSPL